MPEPIGREISPGHRAISRAMLPEELTECPHCGCNSIKILGVFHRVFEQAIVEGKRDDKSLSLDEKLIQELSGIICPNCNIHTIVEDNDVYERESLIFDLHTQIAMLQGRVGTQPEKEWRN